MGESLRRGEREGKGDGRDGPKMRDDAIDHVWRVYTRPGRSAMA